MRQDRHDHQESADQHGEADGRVKPWRVGANTGERASVVPRAGCERVKNFAQAMRAVVVQATRPHLLTIAHAENARMSIARMSSASIAIFTS